MASPTQWTWVWVDSGSWWWTGRPGVLCAVYGVIKSWTRLSDWSEVSEWASLGPLLWTLDDLFLFCLGILLRFVFVFSLELFFCFLIFLTLWKTLTLREDLLHLRQPLLLECLCTRSVGSEETVSAPPTYFGVFFYISLVVEEPFC